MYTLEKHLSISAVNDSRFELLNSIWIMNKNMIPNAQSAISLNFPHYSLHENSHSTTIIKNIESFLGEERIKNLSPTDTWLMLMAAYTHDLGMIVFNNVLEKKWQEKDFQNYLLKVSDNYYDKDLREAALLLVKIDGNSVLTQSRREETINSSLGNVTSLAVRKAVTLITADYFRRSHHERSKEMIEGIDAEFYKYVNSFSMHNIPNRYKTILAEIAYAHGINFYTVLDRLEYTSDGFGGDKMHPRFIAYLLRLGDLLDVDDKRFNSFTSKTFSSVPPHVSQLHEEKHASVKHLLISPRSIEVTVDCKTDEIYRTAREWFDWLQKEVQDQSKEWSNIAPSNLLGMPPTISRNKIKILYKSVEPIEGLMDLRFSITNEKIFEILEGSGIYEDAGFVSLRELIQNSFDAIKIQLWKMIQSGVYDFAIKRHLKEINKIKNVNTLDHDSLIKLISYPIDIPEELWNNFFIDLNISWKEKGEILAIEVHDNGTGISEDTLIRMTKRVGESRNKDTSFNSIKDTMPYWFKPTGAFGIGLQSLFLVNNYFTLQTKTESEYSKEIVFYSAKKGEYSRLTDEQPLINRGTKVIVEISKANFNEVFSNLFDWGLIENYDVFSDKIKDVYIHKIKRYIYKEFVNIHVLNVSILGDKLNFRDFSNVFKTDVKPLLQERTENILVQMDSIIGVDHQAFIVYEKEKIGCTMRIEFFNNLAFDFQQSSNLYIRNKCLVRGIPVKDDLSGYWLTTYFNIVIDFQSPESDKLLSLSRDKFIPKTRGKYFRMFLDDLLPNMIKIFINLFERKYNANTLQEIAVEYLHLEMTSLMTNKDNILNSFTHIYNDFIFPINYLTKLDRSEYKLVNFFKIKECLLISKFYHNGQNLTQETPFEAYAKLDDAPVSGDAIIWKEDHFTNYLLLCNFRRVLIHSIVQEDGIISIVKLKQENSHYTVFYNDIAKNDYMISLVKSNNSVRRKVIDPIQDYADMLAVNEIYDEFYHGLRYVSHYIISPFSDNHTFRTLKSKADKGIIGDDLSSIKNFISDDYLYKLINESLIEFVINNSSSEKHRTKEKILEAYKSLIAEAFFAYCLDKKKLAE